MSGASMTQSVVMLVLVLAGAGVYGDGASAAGATGGSGIASAANARQASTAAVARDTSDAPLAIKTDTARSRAPRLGSATRQIEPTHIAGEIPVPQVLFITARDQRRFSDFHHRRYLRSSRELADATPTPSWMTVTGSARRETAP